MRAIILAAGRGSRMLELTDDKPKCLVEIAGQPLLYWQLAALQAAGVKELAVVTGYKSELIKAAAANAPARFEMLSNPRWMETNMLSTLFCAADWINGEECVVSYSDIVYPAAHVKALLTSPHPVAITYDAWWEELWSLRQENPLTDAETFKEENGKLLEIGGRPQNLDDVKGQYMGLIKIAPSGWEIFEARRRELGDQLNRTDMTSFLRLLLAENVPVGAVRIEGRWCEVDSEDDLLRYKDVLAGGTWRHDWR